MAGNAGGAGHVAGALLDPHGVTATTGPLGKSPVTTSTVSLVESVAYSAPLPPSGHAVSSTDWRQVQHRELVIPRADEDLLEVPLARQHEVAGEARCVAEERPRSSRGRSRPGSPFGRSAACPTLATVAGSSSLNTGVTVATECTESSVTE